MAGRQPAVPAPVPSSHLKPESPRLSKTTSSAVFAFRDPECARWDGVGEPAASSHRLRQQPEDATNQADNASPASEHRRHHRSSFTPRSRSLVGEAVTSALSVQLSGRLPRNGPSIRPQPTGIGDGIMSVRVARSAEANRGTAASVRGRLETRSRCAVIGVIWHRKGPHGNPYDPFPMQLPDGNGREVAHSYAATRIAPLTPLGKKPPALTFAVADR